VVTALAVVATGVLLWAPSLVAQRYSFDARPVHFLVRPDKGWEFLYQVMSLSRGAALGTSSAASERADAAWSNGAGRARSVRLVYVDGPFRAPVPPGGARPPAGLAVVHPHSALEWLVNGRVHNGPMQLIGVLDYGSGRTVWDIRPARRGGA
jgi:hypothetical protein